MQSSDLVSAVGAIVEIALALATLSSVVTIGLTGFFKEQKPNVDPRLFSIPCGSLVTMMAYLATLPVPSSLMEWMSYILIVIIGALVPSGLFDAGVNLLKHAQRSTVLVSKSDPEVTITGF